MSLGSPLRHPGLFASASAKQPRLTYGHSIHKEGNGFKTRPPRGTDPQSRELFCLRELETKWCPRVAHSSPTFQVEIAHWRGEIYIIEPLCYNVDRVSTPPALPGAMLTRNFYDRLRVGVSLSWARFLSRSVSRYAAEAFSFLFAALSEFLIELDRSLLSADGCVFRI